MVVGLAVLYFGTDVWCSGVKVLLASLDVSGGEDSPGFRCEVSAACWLLLMYWVTRVGGGEVMDG